MAFRSFFVALDNQTGGTLTLFGAPVLYHGVWSPGAPFNGPPPETIDPGARGSFRAESEGVGTGVQGRLMYIIEYSDDPQRTETFTFNFNNPTFGSNEFSIYSNRNPSRFKWDWGDPGGADARINAAVRVDTTEAWAALCNVDSLFSRASEDMKRDQLGNLNAFRAGGFQDLPGLEPWWYELNAAIPRLIEISPGRNDLHSAVDRLLQRVDEFMTDPNQVFQQDDVDLAAKILGHLAATDAELSERFAERGLRILSFLPGRTWTEVLGIVSSVRPHADS